MSKPCAQGQSARPGGINSLSSTLNQSPMSVSDLRQSYENVLLESQASASPLEQFSRWFDEAQAAKVPGTQCHDAGHGRRQRPAQRARIVLIKGYDEQGFTFFTNYESRKGTGPAGRAARLPAVLLAAAGTLRAHRGRGGKGRGRGIRRLLPQPARRLADRRLGLAPEPAHHPRRTGSPRAGIPRPLRATSRRACRTGAATA